MYKRIELSKGLVITLREGHFFTIRRSKMSPFGDSVLINVEESVEVVRALKQLYYEVTGEVMEA